MNTKREIKFRVWDTKNKQFLSQSSEYYHIGDVTGIPYTLNEILNKLDRFVVQQFTGEFDKNKKEIYEGDIVRVTSEEWDNENFIAEVIFSEASFLSKIDDNDIRGLWGGDDIEVMGNIFENSKHLKQ